MSDRPDRLTALERKQQKAAKDALEHTIYLESLRGRPVSELAFVHDMPESRIYSIIRRLGIKKYAARQDLADQERQRQLAITDHLTEQCLQILDASRQPTVETKTGNAMLHALTGTVIELPDTIITKTNAGSIAPIQAILKINDQRRKILGMDTEKHEVAIITDEEAEAELRQKMAQLATRTLETDDSEDLSALTDEELTERTKMLREVADSQERRKVEKKLTLLPSQRAETTNVGIDLPDETVEMT